MGKINTGVSGGFASRAEKEAHDRDMERRGYGTEDNRTDKGKEQSGRAAVTLPRRTHIQYLFSGVSPSLSH